MIGVNRLIDLHIIPLPRGRKRIVPATCFWRREPYPQDRVIPRASASIYAQDQDKTRRDSLSPTHSRHLRTLIQRVLSAGRMAAVCGYPWCFWNPVLFQEQIWISKCASELSYLRSSSALRWPLSITRKTCLPCQRDMFSLSASGYGFDVRSLRD